MSRLASLSASPIVRKVFSNTSWLTVEKVIIMMISLAVSVYLARELGPSKWGYLSYLLALVTLLSPFSSLGLNAMVTRELVNHPEHNNKIVITALVFRLCGGIAGVVLCMAAVLLFLKSNSPQEMVLIFMLLVSSLFNAGRVAEFWFQSRMENKYVSMMRISIRLIFAIAKVAVVALAGPMWLLVFVFALELGLIGLGYVLLYLARGGQIEFKAFDFSYGVSLLRQSFWLILSTMASVIYLRVDQIMLANMKGDAAVGIYSVAVKLSEVWFFFPVAFAAAVFPVLLKTRQNSDYRYQQQLQTVCDLLLFAALILSGLVIFAGPWFISTIFGAQYVDSASVLSIQILGSVFVFMRALVSKWLIAESLLKFSFWSEGCGALLNVVLNFILIPKYGYWGAAAATVFSYFFSCFVCFWLFKETRPIARVMTRSLCFPFNWHKPLRLWSVSNTA